MILLLAVLLAQADNRVKLCDKADAKKCATVNASGQVSISGTISASTTGRATAAAPSYVEGTDNPLSIDLTGNIRTLATAQTAAKATAADPTYVEGTTDPISQDLAGYLRVRGVFWQTTQPVSGTFWPTAAGSPSSTRLSDGAAFYDARSIRLLTSSDVVDVSDRSGRALGTIANTSFNVGNFPATYDTSDRAARLLGVVYGSQAQQLKQTATNFNLQTEIAVGGSLVDPRSIRALTSSDTVTTAPPANASTNVTQWNGTTVDTNSGSKSAGTVRVVLATDQPALTNKLLVTPDSVALPANQSVNVAQLAGTTTDTNSGSKSAGTLRVVLATDQPALTNKLLVTPDSVALPANQSVNVAQFGGTNTVTGTGAGGSGIPRVTISNDSSLAANQSVNLAQVGGTNTLTGGTAGSQGVGGLAADAAAVSGNPVAIAGKGFNGVALMPRYCDKVAAMPTTIAAAAANAQVIAAVASQKIYVCAYSFGASTGTTATTLKWTEGTGTNCGTGNAAVGGTLLTTPISAPTTPNVTLGLGNPGIGFTATAGDALCITQASTTNATTLFGFISYTQN